MPPLRRLDTAGDSVRQVIRAYHGSPYDFDSFDFDKIQNGLLGPGLHVSDYEPWVDEYYRKGGRIYELEIDASPDEFMPETVTQPFARAGREEDSLRRLILEAQNARPGEARTNTPASLLARIMNADAVKRIEAAQATGSLPNDPIARQAALDSLRAQSRQTAREAALRSGVIGLRGDWPYRTDAGETIPMKIYSVFDPDRVRILRKYGLMAPVAAGAMDDGEQ